jgi:cytochrome c556
LHLEKLNDLNSSAGIFAKLHSLVILQACQGRPRPQRKFMKAIFLTAAAAALLAMTAPASAQFAKPEDAVKYRQSTLFVMGQHFGRIGAMASGRAPFDAKIAAENAELVASLAKLPWAAFGPGTDKGGDTKAKAEIWTEQAKFKEAGDKLIAESGKLAVAAKTGNLDAVKTAFTATAGTCKSCHDAYRNK